MAQSTKVDLSQYKKIAISPGWIQTGISVGEFLNGLKTLFPSTEPINIGGFDGQTCLLVEKAKEALLEDLVAKNTFKVNDVTFTLTVKE